MRLAFPLLGIALLVVSGIPAAAAPGPVLAEVASGDADLGFALEEARIVSAGFIDANNNGRLDLADPDEPVYLDLDATKVVGYGDLRLSAFLRYPIGSAVDVANRDVGRDLVSLAGWFGRDGNTWYLDSDGLGTVSAGDLLFGATVEKVRSGASVVGHKLTSSSSNKGSLAWYDADRDGARDALEPMFLDADPFTGGARKVSIGDLRVNPQGLGLDEEATKGDVDAAIAALPPTVAQDPSTTTALGADATSTSPSAPVAWRTLDWILVVVGVANLAGLIVVGRLASARHPKNPFK